MDYEVIELLGTGGSGQVYRAWDARLEREVALKVLRAEDPRTEQRLLREARTQSRVQHPHVGQVYEVGTWHGKPAIAMQLVAGLPLDSALDRFRSGQDRDALTPVVVRLFRDVADAVAAAHAAGLVHRDLKPGNVLVEEADGILRPYVVDFGLAMDPSEPAVTVTAQALGTPGYMAPEQALGCRSEIGPATDVYALGSMLYEQLAGVRPHEGADPMAVLLAVGREDPVPLERHSPDVPLDLCLIVGKCLRREPQRRYPDGHGLSADLTRFLDGRGVEARAPTISYRLRRALTRNKAATLLGTAGALVGVSLLSWLLLERSAAASELVEAQEITRTAERLSARLAAAYLEPQHDVSAVHEDVRGQIARLESTSQGLRSRPRAVASTALGLAALAMGDLAHAKRLLESGLHDGDEQARLPLGEVTARLFYERLSATRQLRASQREIELEPARRELRDPALVLLGGDAPQDGQAIRHALSKLLREEPDAAREVLRAVPETAAGTERVAARLLLAEIDAEDSLVKWRTGAHTEARAALDRADDELRQAREVARSDPRIHRTGCRLEAQRAEIDLVGSRDISERKSPGDWEFLTKAPAVCDDAVHVDSRAASGYVARAAYRFHRYRLARPPQATARAVLEIVREDARRAVELDELSVEGWVQLARVEMELADYELEQHRNEERGIARALELLEPALRADPDSTLVLSTLSAIHNGNAYRLAKLGQDPSPAYEESLSAQNRIVALAPRNALVHSTLGATYMWFAADTQHRREPTDLYELSRTALDRAVELDPEYLRSFMHLGSLELFRTDYLQGIGVDYLGDVVRGIGHIERYLKHRPRDPSAIYNLMSLRLERATSLLENRIDAGSALQEATTTQARVEEHDPDTWHCHGLRLQGLLARDAALTGTDPTPYWREAERIAKLALEKDVRTAVCSQGHALNKLYEARWRRERGLDPATALRSGIEATQLALERQPGKPGASTIAGQLWALSAQTTSDAARAEAALKESERAFVRELEANPQREGSVRELLAAVRADAAADSTAQESGR